MVVTVIRPNITDEERQKRIKEISRLSGELIKDTYKKNKREEKTNETTADTSI